MSFIIIPCVCIPDYVRGQPALRSPSEFPANDNGPGGSSSPSEFPTRRSLNAPRSTSELPATSFGSNMTDPRFSLNANMTGARSPSEFSTTSPPLASRSPSEFSTNQQGLSTSNTSSGQQARACSSLAKPSSIVIDTDKTTYLPGQVALIYLRVFDDNGCNVNSTVTIEATHLDSNDHSTVTWRQTALSQSDFFSRFGVNLQELGNYQITANATGLSSKAFTSIKVIPFYESQITGLISISLSAFAALMIVTSLTRLRNTQIGEILRFVCISTLALSVLSTFIFVQDEFGRGAPLGLVRNPTFGAGEWVINIGGTPTNNYAFGVQIPIYVFIFGLAGGYLRYLYKTAKLYKSRNHAQQQLPVFEWNNVPGSDEGRLKEFVKQNFGLAWVEKGILNKDSDGKTINISNGKEQLLIMLNDEDNTAKVLLDHNDKPIYQFQAKERTGGKLVIYPPNISSFYQSLEDIALLFLSPLLAIATWFLLGQAGLNQTTGKFMLVAISFTVGLVTDNVIHALIGFVNSRLGNPTTETTSTTTTKDGTK